MPKLGYVIVRDHDCVARQTLLSEVTRIHMDRRDSTCLGMKKNRESFIFLMNHRDNITVDFNSMSQCHKAGTTNRRAIVDKQYRGCP